jgi:hypothetical protein
MTQEQIFLNHREQIRQSLIQGGVPAENILLNQNILPDALPAGIIALKTETGINGTSRRYPETELNFVIYLIVDAQDVEDPHLDAYRLKEAVRDVYREKLHSDFTKVDYYPSRIRSTQDVMIARIQTLGSSA